MDKSYSLQIEALAIKAIRAELKESSLKRKQFLKYKKTKEEAESKLWTPNYCESDNEDEEEFPDFETYVSPDAFVYEPLVPGVTEGYEFIHDYLVLMSEVNLDAIEVKHGFLWNSAKLELDPMMVPLSYYEKVFSRTLECKERVSPDGLEILPNLLDAKEMYDLSGAIRGSGDQYILEIAIAFTNLIDDGFSFFVPCSEYVQMVGGGQCSVFCALDVTGVLLLLYRSNGHVKDKLVIFPPGIKEQKKMVPKLISYPPYKWIDYWISNVEFPPVSVFFDVPPIYRKTLIRKMKDIKNYRYAALLSDHWSEYDPLLLLGDRDENVVWRTYCCSGFKERSCLSSVKVVLVDASNFGNVWRDTVLCMCKTDVIYYDCEFSNKVLCCVQLFISGVILIFDICSLNNTCLANITKFLEDMLVSKDIFKIGCGTGSDMVLLRRSLGTVNRAYHSVIDVSLFYQKRFNLLVAPSLKGMVSGLFSVNLNKELQNHDWKIRPINTKCLIYMANDVYWLRRITAYFSIQKLRLVMRSHVS